MSTNIDLLSNLGLASSVIGVAVAITTTFIARVLHEKKEKEIKDKITKISKNYPFIAGSDLKGVLSEQIYNMEQDIISSVVVESGNSEEVIAERLKKEIDDFNHRIEKIENRFPPDSKIEKIASINDAIFSERIDYLTKKIKQLEDSQLSKWDVALVVSMIIGAIITIVATTYGVLSFISSIGS